MTKASEILSSFLPSIFPPLPEIERPRSIIACGPECPYDFTVRTMISDIDIAIYGWPFRGGVIILDNAQAIDLEFVGLNPLKPQGTRDTDQDSEDHFCQRLLLNGAKWFDSCARQAVLERFENGDGNPNDDRRGMGRGPHAFPTLREKRWVCVAWPSTGGFVVSEFETSWGGISDPENEVPGECPGLAKVRLARSMDERAEILRNEFRGKCYNSLEEYVEGQTFLRAWEWKWTGEVGRRLLSAEETMEEWSSNLMPVFSEDLIEIVPEKR